MRSAVGQFPALAKASARPGEPGVLTRSVRHGSLAGERLWEVDALRGSGAVMMLAFHLLWDLAFLGLWGGNVHAGWPLLLALSTGVVFLGVVGMSLSVRRGRGGGMPFRRSLQLLLLALAVTTVTALLFPGQAILFGVLHCIALSLLIVHPLASRPALAAVVGAAMVGAGVALSVQDGGAWPLLLLGLPPDGLATLDYYPLLPWAGVVALGAALGAVVFPHGRRRGAPRPCPRWARPLGTLGRRSLLIYLIHQPLLLALLLPVRYLV